MFIATCSARLRTLVGTRSRAQDVVEYGLLIATVALIVLVATTAFGQTVLTWFETLAGRITTVGT